MRKIIWPILAIISLILSTYAFILGSKIIQNSQTATPIYITYPDGYKDLPDLPSKPKVVKSRKTKLEKP